MHAPGPSPYSPAAAPARHPDDPRPPDFDVDVVVAEGLPGVRLRCGGTAVVVLPDEVLRGCGPVPRVPRPAVAARPPRAARDRPRHRDRRAVLVGLTGTVLLDVSGDHVVVVTLRPYDGRPRRVGLPGAVADDVVVRVVDAARRALGPTPGGTALRAA